LEEATTSDTATLEQTAAKVAGLPPLPVRVSRQKPPKMNTPERRTLSKISREYDINHKGHLDDIEQKMRSMDKSNLGHLSNEVAYDILRQSVQNQKQMVTQRWLILGLSCFAVILALANMGSAFAAAYLAKDTEITTDGDLASKNTHERVSTTSLGYSIDLSSPIMNKPEMGGSGSVIRDGDGERRLGIEYGMLNYEVSSFNTISKSQNFFLFRMLSNPKGIPTGIRLNWSCGKDGVGAYVGGFISSVESLPYKNVDGNGVDGTLYTYDVNVHGETYKIAVDCVDGEGVTDCIVDGTRCCMTDADCGGGETCNFCGCQCGAHNDMFNRCDSGCADGLGEEITFRE